MSETTKRVDARRDYAAAYLEHYTTKDLGKALDQYWLIVTAYPNAPEAAYARSQIQNIVNTVVPKQEFLRAQVELATAHLAGRADGKTLAE